MSRMTKYLHQKCSYEKIKVDDAGRPLLDKYGEPQYDPPVLVRCRRETYVQDVETNTGAVLKCATRYLTDDSQSIKINDKLDNRTVISVQEYVDQFGRVEGFECYVS